MTDEPIPLTELAKRFAEEYVIDFCVAKAADRAGCSAVHGHKMLKDPRVDAMIRESKRRTSFRVDVSIDNVLNDLRIFKSISAADYFQEVDEMLYPIDKHTGLPLLPIPTGRKILVLKPLADWSDDMRHALKSISHTANGVKIETFDKVAADVNIGKFFGMFVEKHELSGPGGKPIEMIAPTMTPKEAADMYAATLQGNQ